MRQLLSIILSFMLIVTLAPPLQASANEDVPFDEYGVRVNSSEAYQQLQAEEKWVEFDEEKDVKLNKEWKINFSAIATPNKIKAITIEHKDKPIEVKVSYNSSIIVTVKPDKRFAGNQKYTIKILLNNGKKYKKDFVTATADEEPNDEYKDASDLYIEETIQGDLLVNPKTDTTDFYKINVPKDGKLNINVRRLDKDNTVSIHLYDKEGEDGDLLAYAENKTSALLERELKAGDYYIKVSSHTGSGRYELKTSFTAKTVSPEEALQAAQDAVYALPAPMDVTAEHDDAIRTALTLIATAKAVDADPIALEKLEAIVVELQKIVLPIKILAATVLNSTTFEVRFNRAVDPSVAQFKVTKEGNIAIGKPTVTFNANKTVAKVEMSSNLNDGSTNKDIEYTLNVNGLDSGIFTATVTVKPETVASIEIPGNYANRITMNEATIDYKVKNQYGEDITDTTTAQLVAKASMIATGAVVKKAEVTSKGKVTVTTTGAQEGDSVTLTLTHGEVSATKTVKISAQASVEGIKILGVYNQKEDKLNDGSLKETTVFANEKFYLLIEATDQYDAPVTDLSILNTPNVIRLDHTDPTVVKFAAPTEFVEVKDEKDKVKGIGLPLTGTPKLGETIVTLTAIASDKKASHKVIVAESTRTDEIDLEVPGLITAGETLFIPIIAKDKDQNQNVITDKKIIESPVSGIKFTITPSIPYTIEERIIKVDGQSQTEIGIVFAESKVVAGSFTIKAESSTKKFVMTTISIKEKALPSTWKEISANSIRKDINLVDSSVEKSQKIDETKVRFIDQYGNPIAELPAGYSLVVTDANPTGGAVSVVDNTITPIAVGTEVVTIGIKNGATVVVGSEQKITFTVVAGIYIAYEVEDIGIVYDEFAAVKAARVSVYDKPINVYGVLADGTKIPLEYGKDKDFTLDAVHPILQKDIQVDGILKIDTTASDQYTYGNASEINTEVTIIIKSSGEKYKQKVTISKAIPKVVKIQSSQQDMAYDNNTTPKESFSFEKLVTATKITAIDQYGVESIVALNTPEYQFEFPDGTKVVSKLNFITVSGGHLFANNNSKNAKVTDFTSKSSFNAVVSVWNVSNSVKVTVEDAYMPSVDTEAKKISLSSIGTTLDNNINVLDKAQGLVGEGYAVTIKSSSKSAIDLDGNVTQESKDVENIVVVFKITNNTNSLFSIEKSIKLTVSEATKVTLDGSLGIAGNEKITGLPSNTRYVVTDGINYFGVLANGELAGARFTKMEAEADAQVLTGAEIKGLTNGTNYKVDIVAPTEVTVTGPIGVAGDKKITGLIATNKYVVIEGANKYYGVLANGTLSAPQTTLEAAGGLAVALSGTTITGLTNGTAYRVENAPAVALTGVTATAGNGSATISFTAPTGATEVKVQKSENRGSWTNAGTADATSTQVTVENLTNGIPYRFHLVVTGGYYAGTSNETAAVIPVAQLTGVTATAGDTKAKVTFKEPTGATSVRVQQSTDGNSWSYANTILLDANSREAEVNGLKNGTTYYFRVEVVGGAHEGFSNRTTNITPVATISTQVIAGITVPVRGETPVTKIADTTEYTATITWSPNTTPFEALKPYRATITIKPKLGYTLEGIVADFFTVAGATTVTNDADSGVVTAEFPATGAVPDPDPVP